MSNYTKSLSIDSLFSAGLAALVHAHRARQPKKVRKGVSPLEARALARSGDNRHHFYGRYEEGERFQDSRGRWYYIDKNGSHRRLREAPNGRS